MMFRIALFTCSVVVSIMFLNMVQSLDRKIQYDRSDALDGASCLAEDVILEEESKSPISCLTECTGKPCDTIFYNNETRTCTGCTRWYTSSTSKPPSSGTMAYRTPEPAVPECANDEGSYGTSCYNVIPISTWHEAKTTCASVAYRYVAVPDSIEEMQAILSWLKGIDTSFGAVHLGISDEAVEGTYKTVHGETQDFFYWNTNEPSGGSENCVVMYDHGRWNDASCSRSYLAVCEKNMIAK